MWYINHCNIPLMKSIKVNEYTYRGSNFTIFASPFNMVLLLKERICSNRSKFFPLRVDPMSKSYLIQRNKQEFMQVNITLFSEKEVQGILLDQGHFLRLIWPGLVAQSVGHLTHTSEVLGSIPGLATYFRFSFR